MINRHARQLFFCRHLLAKTLLLRSQFRSQLSGEVLRLKNRANLDFRSSVEWSSFEPLDGFIDRPHLPEPKAGDQLLRLRERSIDDSPLFSSEPHPFAF